MISEAVSDCLGCSSQGLVPVSVMVYMIHAGAPAELPWHNGCLCINVQAIGILVAIEDTGSY